VAIALLSVGCDNGGAKEADKPVALTPIQLSDEDLLQLGVKTLSSGPTITGSILPEKRADLRAEVSAVVLTVLRDNGDPVKKDSCWCNWTTPRSATLHRPRQPPKPRRRPMNRPSASTSAW
jgi:hypothetical protein